MEAIDYNAGNYMTEQFTNSMIQTDGGEGGREEEGGTERERERGGTASPKPFKGMCFSICRDTQNAWCRVNVS